MAVCYCNNVTRDYRRLVQGQRALELSLLRNNTKFSQNRSSMGTEKGTLTSKIDFFKHSQDYDFLKYDEQSSSGISSQKLLTSWKKMSAEVDRMSLLLQDIENLEQQCRGISTKILEIERSPFGKSKQMEVLENVEKQAVMQYETLRQLAKEGKKYPDNRAMAKYVYQCISHSSKLTGDLYQHLGKITECNGELLQLIPQVKQRMFDIQTACSKLSDLQRQRQGDIWKLLKVLVTKVNFANSLRNNEASLTPPSIQKRSDSQSSTGSAAIFDKSSEESLFVLNENQDTRIRCEEMLTSFREEPPEVSTISSLDWGFLSANVEETDGHES